MSQFKRLFVMLGPQMRHTPALQRAAANKGGAGQLTTSAARGRCQQGRSDPAGGGNTKM